jgi:hypothetical protein
MVNLISEAHHTQLNNDDSTYIATLSVCGSTAICWTFAVFQFLDPLTQTLGHLGRGISPSQSRYLHTVQHKHRIKRKQTSMPQVGFEPTIPVFERTKTVRVSNRAAGHCDRLSRYYGGINVVREQQNFPLFRYLILLIAVQDFASLHSVQTGLSNRPRVLFPWD